MQQNPTEQPKQSSPLYNVCITFFSNLKTGEMVLNIDYLSLGGTSLKDHGDEHKKLIEKIMAKMGELHGGLTVRIFEQEVETTYEVLLNEEAEWEMKRISESQLQSEAGQAGSSSSGDENSQNETEEEMES
jgi:hypothetical protein